LAVGVEPALPGDADVPQRSREDFERESLPHLGALYRTALRMTGKDAAAEDAVQETYLRAWRYYPQYKDGTNFKAWIFTILHSIVVSTGRREAMAPMATDWSEGEPEAAPEVQYLSADDLETIGQKLGDVARGALLKMPPDLRIVFLLSSVDELSYKEISETVGIPLGTVMSRLFRARTFLRKELSDAAGSPRPESGRSTP
jgi:RNA polymerase sigma-70 factor (ECF subfamily)